jgi:hypothetical protein
MPNFNDRFPHALINVDDISRRPEIVETPQGLHKPLFIGYASRGPMNVPTRGSTQFLQEIYGEEIFDTQSKFFQPPNMLMKAALTGQEVWYVRVGDESNMSASTLVLEAKVHTTSLIQYEKDASGNRVLDEDDLPIPILDGATPLTEPGIHIEWVVRALDIVGGETLTNLVTSTAQVGDDEITTYPIMAIRAKDLGAFANSMGFRLYFTRDAESSVFDRIDSITYRFEPVKLNVNENIVTSVRGISNGQFLDISLKENALDTTTRMYYDLNEQLESEYIATDGAYPHSLFPMDFHVYSEHVKTIGDRILAVSSELSDLGITAYRINILSGTDTEGRPYDHMEVLNGGSTFFHPNRINYFQGGADGDLTWNGLQDLTGLWLEGELYPEMLDEARYPFNFLWDPGYRFETKVKMLSVLGLRGDVRPMMCSQDFNNPGNTSAQDISTGIALRAAASLYPESTYFGTPVARADIYTQAGKLSAEPLWKNWVPATYDILLKTVLYEGAANNQITDSPGGLPNSAVTVFSEVNWTPATDSLKRRLWDNGLNYMQYYDTNGLHWPDYRTVYPYDNSILSSSLFVNKLVYVKQRCRLEWATHSGSNLPDNKINKLISDNLEQWIYNTFGGQVRVEVTVFKTAADNALGYRKTIRVTLSGNIPDRIYHFEIPVDRIEE